MVTRYHKINEKGIPFSWPLMPGKKPVFNSFTLKHPHIYLYAYMHVCIHLHAYREK